MRISARTEYAVRALLELAAADGATVKADRVAEAQSIPIRFLENIFAELRRGGLVESRRGPDGGHRLAREAGGITIADVVRAIDGPLANIRGERPEAMVYTGASQPLTDVWVALRKSMRDVLEHVSLADIASGALPTAVTVHSTADGAWEAH